VVDWSGGVFASCMPRVHCSLTRALDGRNLRCNTTGSCQSTATSDIVKRAVPVSCKLRYIRIRPFLPFNVPEQRIRHRVWVNNASAYRQPRQCIGGLGRAAGEVSAGRLDALRNERRSVNGTATEAITSFTGVERKAGVN